jgi:hypothetical protein
MSRARVLVLPGYADSGPDHWQTLWEGQFGYVRVVQQDYLAPDRGPWVATLERAVRASPDRAVLVAHSLGCILVAHWAETGTVDAVQGALLVAPPDVDEAREFVPELASFAPVPRRRLPFPSMLVASTDDPYCDPARARELAEGWGARLVDAGAAGHLNAESGLGAWPAGHALLAELLATS